MLLLLIQYLYVLFVCLYIGKLAGDNLLKLKFANAYHYFGLGVITVAVFSRIWTIFFNGGIILQGVLLLLAGLSVFINRKLISARFDRWGSTKLAVASLFVLFFSSQQSISYDEGLYHASFIGWFNDYGTLKGLANVHGRLGFNSNWHFFTSVFNFRGISAQPFNQLNGLFLLVTLLFFETEKKNRPIAARFIDMLGLMLFFPILFVYHVIDPSADYIVILWSLILLYEVFYFKDKQDSNKDMAALLFISTCFLFTIKLSVASMLLPLLFVMSYVWTDKKTLGIVVSGCIVIVGSWLYSNYLLSGYIIYPYLEISSLSPAWKVPVSVAASEIEGVKYTPLARWTGLDYEAIRQLSYLEKIKLWFAATRAVEKLLFLMTATSLLLALFINRKEDKYKLAAIISCIAGFVFIISSAPDFRFYATYLFFAIPLIVANVRQFRLSGVIIVIALITETALTLKLYTNFKHKVNNPEKNWHAGLGINLVKPEKYPLSDKDSISINGLKVYTFDEGKLQFAWDVVPSAYHTYDKDLHLIDSTDIHKGFCIRK